MAGCGGGRDRGNVLFEGQLIRARGEWIELCGDGVGFFRNKRRVEFESYPV